jgi:hypothetical protein
MAILVMFFLLLYLLSVLLVVLAGDRNATGNFVYRGTYAIFWSSSESGANAFRRNLSSTKSGVYRYANNKANGFSVRCLRIKINIFFLHANFCVLVKNNNLGFYGNF